MNGTFAEVIPVELRETEAGWQLLRGGKPFFICGAGGSYSLQALADAGANSIRTWGQDNIDDLLDEAHSLGLAVTVGLWLGHERHGFDYNDGKQVAEQLEKVCQIVRRHKNHPAVLLWGVGNEAEGFEPEASPAVWKAVNDIGAAIKKLDPNHPTMTVTAELSGDRIDRVHRCCPAIDIHGINSYGIAPSIAERFASGGATKPYIITEFGPPGPWESDTTEWGAPYEMTSTRKADFYERVYTSMKNDQSGLSLGSYAFAWGFKMEATATWFGMFLADGARLGVVDRMTKLWSGAAPEYLAPSIEPLRVDGDAQFNPMEELHVQACVGGAKQGLMRAHWVLRPESGDYMTGGDFRPDMPDIDGAILDGDLKGAIVRMPKDPGAYRLFLYVYDETGGAATANLPLFVKAGPEPDRH